MNASMLYEALILFTTKYDGIHIQIKQIFSFLVYSGSFLSCILHIPTGPRWVVLVLLVPSPPHRCTFLDHQNLFKIIQMYHG